MTVLDDGARVRALPGSGEAAASRVLTVLSTAGAVLVAATVPVARGVVGPGRFSLAVCVVVVGLVVLGRAAVPVAGVIWVCAAPLIGVGAAAAGPDSVRAAVPLIVLVVVAPFAIRGLQVQAPRVTSGAGVGFVCAQSVSAAVGAAQYAGRAPFGVEFPYGRPQGLAGHPNVLGLMAGLAILILVHALLTGTAPRAASSLLLVLNSVALVASGSLSALGASVVAIALMLWVLRRVSVVAVVLLAVAPVGYLLSGYVPVLRGLVDTVSYRSGVVLGEHAAAGNASVDIRLQTYRYAIEYISGSPIYGVGLQDSVSGTYNGTTAVHNFFLRGWYQGGLPYAIWLLLLVAALLVRVIGPAALKRRDDLALPASGVVLILVFAATAAFLEQAQYWLPLIFFAAMASPPRRLLAFSSASPQRGRLTAVARND